MTFSAMKVDGGVINFLFKLFVTKKLSLYKHLKRSLAKETSLFVIFNFK